MVEFAVCCLVMMPLLLGTIAIGLALVRAIQVTQVCRDTGHMSANGVDFSLSGNRPLLVRVANGLGIPGLDTSGSPQPGATGAIILTTVTYLTDCGSDSRCSSCTNKNFYVIVRQIPLGDITIPSSIGTAPPQKTLSSSDCPTQYMVDTRYRASSIPSQISLLLQNGGQTAFVSEVSAIHHDLDWTGFIGSTTKARFFF
jgi:hypothetical protein